MAMLIPISINHLCLNTQPIAVMIPPINGRNHRFEFWDINPAINVISIVNDSMISRLIL